MLEVVVNWLMYCVEPGCGDSEFFFCAFGSDRPAREGLDEGGGCFVGLEIGAPSSPHALLPSHDLLHFVEVFEGAGGRTGGGLRVLDGVLDPGGGMGVLCDVLDPGGGTGGLDDVVDSGTGCGVLRSVVDIPLLGLDELRNGNLNGCGAAPAS